MDLETIVGFISIQVASGFLKEHGKEIYQKVKGVLMKSSNCKTSRRGF
jgi:ascorbate-specific PTS system EIIC-type component UlaA